MYQSRRCLKRDSIQVILLSLLLCANISFVKAQQLTGKILTAAGNKPLAGALITVRATGADIKATAQSVSKEDGSFNINMQAISLTVGRNYHVILHAIGYKDVTMPLSAADLRNGKNLGNILMESAVTALNNVTLEARRKMLSRRVDRWVLNPAKNLNAAGMSALEATRLLPGVSLIDNNIRVNGKSGVVYLINGRASSMDGGAVADFLKNLSPDQISSIELMTAPPAKYSAAGTAAIINIVLKKSALNGFSGNVSSQFEQGKYSASRNNVHLGYKTIDVDANAYINGNITNSFSDGDEQRAYYGNSSAAVNARYYERHKPKAFSYYQTLNFNLNRKNNLYLDYRVAFDKDPTTVTSRADILNSGGAYTLTQNNTLKKSGSFGANAAYQLDFDTLKKHSLEISATAFTNNNPIGAVVQNSFYNNVQGAAPYNKAVNNITNNFKGYMWGAAADYTGKISESSTVEAGIKYTGLQNRSHFMFNSADAANQLNDFKYDEDNMAAYGSYGFSVGKAEFKVGLRAERTGYKGNTASAGRALDSAYTKVFPTLYTSFHLTKDIGFSANYSKRIMRPDFRDLNPFRYYYDPYSYVEGNPSLRPYYVDNVEAEISFWDSYYLTAGYSYGKDVIADLTQRYNDELAVITFKGNLAAQHNYYAGLGGQNDITKWWNFSWQTGLARNIFRGAYAAYNIDNKVTEWRGSVFNNFVISKSWTASLSGWLNGPFTTGIDKYKAIGSASASIQKKYKGFTLQAGVKDIFNTQRERVTTTLSNQRVYLVQKHDYQRVWLRVAWAFDNNKSWIKNRKYKQRGNFDDDESRVTN